MTSTTTYPYTLQRYQGRTTRYTCPACQKPHCFTRYLDTATGELLDEGYGRCDHELNCGYHRSPYQNKPLKSQPCLPSWTASTPQPGAGPTSTTWLAPPKVYTIPAEVLELSMQPSHYKGNALVKLLRNQLGVGDADSLVRRFQLGTSAYWPGACIFWLIDEHGRIRGGQVVLYDETGHTVKTPYRHTCWVHTAYTERCQQLGMPVPSWLADYTAYGQKSPCLFGLPQLPSAPAGQPVALVESAKTAMLAAFYMPQFVWLATMGLSNLTEERLRPLKGREIWLYPDAGALEKWRQKADNLRRLGYDIQVSELLEKEVTPAERKAGLDLGDFLLHEWRGYPPSLDARQLS